MEDLTKTREIWEDVIARVPQDVDAGRVRGLPGQVLVLPPRKILPKPYVKPHPPMWYAAGNTTSYEMAARKGLGVLGFSVRSLDEMEPVLKAYKNAIGQAEPIGAFVNDNLMVTSRRTSPRTRKRTPLGRRLPCQLPEHQRVPLPRHVPPPGLGPDMARAASRSRPEELPASLGTGGRVLGDPIDALAAVPELGGGGRRPAGVRHRSRHRTTTRSRRSGSSAST